MQVDGKVVVVTGGGGGIGAALCRRFRDEGAAALVVADLNGEAAEAVAAEVGGAAIRADVTVEADVQALVQRTVDDHGRVDLYCSNAGIGVGGGFDAPDATWQRAWEVHAMAHIYAARAVVPGMVERGEGWFLGTISAAGLLNHVLAAPYSVTKAAGLSFLEWLSIAYGDEGVGVSALCPQGVRTAMLGMDRERPFLQEGALEPDEVAAAVVDALRDERFLVLPHPEVAEYFRRKATDYDRWLRGMRRLRERVVGQSG
ncbi:MAG TPA: SDR family oxidoreductase [Candidatus Dormibacteraeota bacterium]|jgi:NAD(P)-dependent dehydrogenase (short-subunit alcohol dehydrogenase family)